LEADDLEFFSHIIDGSEWDTAVEMLWIQETLKNRSANDLH